MSNRGNFIENEARYEAAIARNIRQNARKTRMEKFLSTADGVRVHAFLHQIDEFESTYRDDGHFDELHPVVKASFGDFYTKMHDSLVEWGGLTDGQMAAVIRMIERSEARVAERAKAREEARQADADKSGWVGAIGERRDFDLTIRILIEMEGQWGFSYLHVCNDTDGNVIVYKGTNKLGGRGDVASVKATVKEHDVRDGVKQTKISRPKVK